MNISDRAQIYDEAFDFYIENEKMPDTIQPDDLLGAFICQTLQDNPQLTSQDPLWLELLKEEVMKFIGVMLNLFQPLELQHRKEKQFIAQYADASLDKKRQVWGKAYQIIKNEYVPEEVNIDGYIVQMKKHDPKVVLSTMIKDWDKACDERLRKQKQSVIDKYRQKWERQTKDNSLTDFKQQKAIERLFYSYPALEEIVRTMGREQSKQKDMKDDFIKLYHPLLPSPPKPSVEIEEVTTGNHLRHMLPSEIAIMSDPETEDLFFLKYVSNKLQLFANKPKEENMKKVRKRKEEKPRLEKGPMIVCLDTSGSMSGRSIQVAISLLLQLLRMARKQKRKCFLITFAVRAKYIDLAVPGAWRKLDSFLNDRFGGGTNGEEMLKTTLQMLQKDSYEMADVLIISDFEFPLPLSHTLKQMKEEQAKGTRFYGLQIGYFHHGYKQLLDRIWKVELRRTNKQ